MRAFIAIELSKEIKERLEKLQSELKKSQADVKWVEADNIHLSLKFLGEINQAQLEKISAIIKDTTKNTPCFSLHVCGLGTFPKIDFPRVIWVGFDKGSNETKTIAEKLEGKIAELGITKEDRPFWAHITIGRVRSEKNRLELVKSLKDLAENFRWDISDYFVEKITLFKSTLSPKGPAYEPIIESNLSKT